MVPSVLDLTFWVRSGLPIILREAMTLGVALAGTALAAASLTSST